jgi:hypothetical protein
MSCDRNALVMMAATAIVLLASDRSCAQDDKWGTIKGQVVWGGDKIPPRKVIKLAGNQAVCVANPTYNPCDGTVLDEDLLINEKTKGIKNAFVWLINDPKTPLPIHPALKNFPKEIVIDQPACMFFPRALAMREGQVFVVKNTSQDQHNIRWIGDDQGGNVTIKAGGKVEIKDLKAQRLPLLLECNLHGWMKGRLAVLDHPYFAITDDNGNFEIKNAPAGNFKIMIYHEVFAYRLGFESKYGEQITIKSGVNDMGKLPAGGK